MPSGCFARDQRPAWHLVNRATVRYNNVHDHDSYTHGWIALCIWIYGSYIPHVSSCFVWLVYYTLLCVVCVPRGGSSTASPASKAQPCQTEHHLHLWQWSQWVHGDETAGSQWRHSQLWRQDNQNGLTGELSSPWCISVYAIASYTTAINSIWVWCKLLAVAR